MSVSVGIVGASGMVGKYLADGFLSNGKYNVSLLTRKGGNAAALAPFAARGAKIVETDFDNEASLTGTLKGLEIVVSAVGATALQGQHGIIKAAKAAGVRRFVPSEFGMDTTRQGVRDYFPALGYKFAVQDDLEKSGLEWTYVVNGFFLETQFSPAFFFDIPNGKATIKGNPDSPFVVTSLKDIARWTAAALLDPASENSTIYLKGEEITYNQVVQTIEKATGKQLEVTYVSGAELESQIKAAPDLWASFLDLLAKAIADGWGGFSGQWSGQDAPSTNLAKFATEGKWGWDA